jgi:hypothetical protein
MSGFEGVIRQVNTMIETVGWAVVVIDGGATDEDDRFPWEDGYDPERYPQPLLARS